MKKKISKAVLLWAAWVSVGSVLAFLAGTVVDNTSTSEAFVLASQTIFAVIGAAELGRAFPETSGKYMHTTTLKGAIFGASYLGWRKITLNDLPHLHIIAAALITAILSAAPLEMAKSNGGDPMIWVLAVGVEAAVTTATMYIMYGIGRGIKMIAGRVGHG